MGVTLFGDGAGTVPAGAVFLAGGKHIPDTVGKVFPLFDDGAPGGPDRGPVGNGEHIPESLQILPVERRIADLLHIVRRGCPLGIDIEHDERVEAVAKGDPLHGF